MLFTRDFEDDYTLLVEALAPWHSGFPLVFARYADGEAAIMFGRQHRAKSDGWTWNPETKSTLPERLLASIRYGDVGWHMGITCEDHHRKDHHLLLKEARIGLSFITFAEIFIFANYPKFQTLDLDHCCTIGTRGEIKVPGRPDDSAWEQTVDELVSFMVQCSRPMLVSAGPWSCVLIHEYWKRCPQNMRRVVIDVGSAMDERMRGRTSRKYQQPGSGLQSWVPRWTL